VSPPASANFNRIAAPFVTSADGSHTYQFLFWNTGRHLTGKRSVTWTFRRFSWGIWTAVKWYGTPPVGNGGPPRVRADGFSVGGNAVLTGSPIDGAASTFAGGSWPFQGDDHAIGTANGDVTVVANAHSGAETFGGWAQLIWGGDATGDFQETDDGTTGNFGTSGFFEVIPAGTNPFYVPGGTSADLLAAYVPEALSLPIPIDIDRIRQLLADVSQFQEPPHIDPRGDSAVIDRLRLTALAGLLQQTAPASGEGRAIHGLLEAVPRMTETELHRAKQSVQTTLDLAKTTLKTIDARLKRTK
jgi:hypothetical protein